ncbi:uncharacterized protein LOC135167015 [Diachasmimorpha longicaudata]|uniref:uncharacterized protein LOC135167015 n=1 Tax=Diachasmimorpha longicaudata TaxID=58733 RepID=UPI0030B88907
MIFPRSFGIMWNSLRFTNSLRNLRNFSVGSMSKNSQPKAASSPATGEASKTNTEQVLGPFQHRVTDFDKWILVVTKKYPSKDQVPTLVADNIMQNAMSKARIGASTVIMVLTGMYALYTVVTSKKVQKEYLDNMEHTRTDYRQQVTEEFRQKMAEASAKKP